MSNTSKEATARYLRQIFIAAAILLVLYGIMQMLSFLSDLTNVATSYWGWIIFQIIAAIFIIFIGLRVYSLAKTIRSANLTQLSRGTRPQLLGLFLAFLALAPIMSFPLSAASPFHPLILRPDLVHTPISFPYKLYYGWNYQDSSYYQSGGYVLMLTTRDYPSTPYKILADVISVSRGWVIVPYEVDGSNAFLQSVGPAEVRIELGTIENGEYLLKVVMSNAVDVFTIHKTDYEFWIEQVKASKGDVVEKSGFDKRLDGFAVHFSEYREIDNETKSFVSESIREIGGQILDTKPAFEGSTTFNLDFYYRGDFSSLQQIVIQIARNHPEYWIGIMSNTGWYALTVMYNLAVVVRNPENADSVKQLILQKGLMIFEEKRERFIDWNDAIRFSCSSTPLNTIWTKEMREDLVKLISQDLGLKEGSMEEDDFWVSP